MTKPSRGHSADALLLEKVETGAVGNKSKVEGFKQKPQTGELALQMANSRHELDLAH